MVLLAHRMRSRGCISSGTEIGLMTRLKGTVANCTGHKVGVLSYCDARFTHHYVFKRAAPLIVEGPHMISHVDESRE